MKQITGPSLAFLDGRFVNVPGDTMTGALVIDGSADAVQAVIQAHSSQTANIWENQLSDASVVSGADERGILFSDGGTDYRNVFIGDSAGNNTATGTSNVMIGNLTGALLAAGLNNFGLGTGALQSAVSNNSCIAIGVSALAQDTNSSGNIGIGGLAMSTSDPGNFNIAIGYRAGRLVASSAINNLFIGRESGASISSGGSNIFLGYYSGHRQTTLSNLFIVDNQVRADAATEITNSILYGVMAAAPADQTLRINANLITSEGRTKNTTRATTTYTILVTDDVIFANTDGAAWTATLPAGVEGQTFKIINSGSSANDLTVAPDGSEHLIGANSNFTLTDGETLVITYNATDGWY